MNFETLVGKELCSSIFELRENTDSYEEVVVLSQDISTWKTLLTEKLGPPLLSPEKYNDQDSSKIDAALQLSEPFGGIAEGQTLYHGTYNSTVILIMIWPWQNNINVTLKKAIL